MNKLSKWTMISLGALTLALLCLFLFNFETTRQSFIYIIGPTYLVTLLAIAISLIDAAGVYMVFVGASETKDMLDDWFMFLLLLAWVLSSISDIALTYFWAHMRTFDSPAAMTGRIEPIFLQILPWVVSLSEFGMRVPLVIIMGRGLAKAFSRTPRIVHPGQSPMAGPGRPVPSYPPISPRGVGFGPVNPTHNNQKRQP